MDFDNPPPAAVAEFLAVLFAGFGNNLNPLTSDDGDEACPKALLPIANKPMIDYPLAWLEQSGIRDVLLICPSRHRSAISNHIDNDSSSSSFASLRVDIQGVEDVSEAEQGTSAILTHFASRIKTDFIIIPCDFIPPPSLPLLRMLNMFRAQIGSEEGIVTSCWFETPNEKPSFEESDRSSTSIPIVWDAASSTLLHVSSASDHDKNNDELILRASLLARHPRVRMSTKFQDSHVYICRRSILHLLEQKPRLESFRDDFFPWLCKLQYQTTRRDKYGRVVVPLVKTDTQIAALQHSTMQSGSRSGARIPLSGTGSPEESEQDTSVSHASLRIGVVLHRLTDGCPTRVNTLNSFLDANRRAILSPDYTYTPPSEPDRRSLVDVKAQVSTDSMVGDSTKVGERTAIKKSVIGKHCTIGKMVKIAGCVILDHCVIEDGAKLESCLLGRNTKVGAKADLSRCATQSGYEVDAGETLKNDKLETSNWAAGDHDGNSSASDSSESEDGSDE